MTELHQSLEPQKDIVAENTALLCLDSPTTLEQILFDLAIALLKQSFLACLIVKGLDHRLT